MLRVALVGYGLAGRIFHRPLVTAAGFEITSVVTTDPGRRGQVAAELPGAQLLERPAQLWARAADHDLVVVATATPSHRAVVVAALRSGVAVVVDKPMAPTLRQARDMVGAAEIAGRALVPFHNRRWDAEHLTLRRLLADGALGRVLRYESRFERFRPRPAPGAWRESTPGRRGGGVLLDLGTHLVDQAVDLFGPVARVYAEVDARRGGADDDVFMALEHAGGVRAHLWAGALAGAPGPRLRVLGTEGAFVVDHFDGQEDQLRAGMAADDPAFGECPPERWGRIERGSRPGARVVPSERGAWTAFYRALPAALSGDEPPPATAAQALVVQAVLDSARTSAERHRVVTL